jgi:Mrp family chromosome partitioning ATPase/capsular polysaccharide biosynthesis protein
MATVATISPQPPDERLPFDLRTMLLSLLRHWYIAALCIIAGVGVGLIVAYSLGSQTWKAETVLLYKPPEEDSPDNPNYTPPPLSTQMNLVKIRSNLEETLQTLNLDTRLEVFGKAIDVFIQDQTDLMTISVTWETAPGAAAIANTLRDVFMANQQRIRKRETDKSVDHMLRQAEIDRQTLDRQIANMGQQAEALKTQVSAEQTAANIGDVQREMDIRSTRLREAISQDQEYRSRVAELTKAELDLERAQKALERGVISKAEYDAVRAEYERLKALTVDTDQVRTWRTELGNLERRLTTVPEASMTPSVTMLSEMRMKMFELQLQQIALDNKIRYLEEARTAEVSDFTVISEAQIPTRPYRSNRRLLFMATVLLFSSFGFGVMVVLELLDATVKSAGELRLKFKEPILGNIPHVKIWHQVFSGLIPLPYEAKLGLNQFESPIMESFRIISRHMRAAVPKRGARVLIVSAHHGEGKSLAAVYMAACLGRQDERVLVVDAYIRSTVDQQRFADFSNQITAPASLLGRVETLFRDPISSLFGGQRSRMDDSLASSSFTLKLYQWARRVSRQQPSTSAENTRLIVRDLIPENEQHLKGLGEFLSYQADELSEITWPTVLSGVECLPHIGKAVIPELLGSNRMRELMEAMSERYSIILIDGPPVLPYVDAELLAQQCDVIIFVVRSQWCQIGMVRKAFERLQRSGTPVVGIILNDVDSLYLESA